MKFKVGEKGDMMNYICESAPICGVINCFHGIIHGKSQGCETYCDNHLGIKRSTCKTINYFKLQKLKKVINI